MFFIDIYYMYETFVVFISLQVFLKYNIHWLPYQWNTKKLHSSIRDSSTDLQKEYDMNTNGKLLVPQLKINLEFK